MKEPEEYLKISTSLLLNELLDQYPLLEDNLEVLIESAQKDAYNQALEDATNIVDWNYCGYSWEIPEGCPSTGDSEYGYYYINKESILKLKK